MRLIKKPISLFLALIPLLIHGGILGKYYIESVEIDDEKDLKGELACAGGACEII